MKTDGGVVIRVDGADGTEMIPKRTRTKVAFEKLGEARRLRSDGRIHNRIAADRLEDEANIIMAPTECMVSLREAVPEGIENIGIRDALENPDCVAIEASETRMKLLCDAEALELGAECAESIQAQNSVERMLAHQMATAHILAMKLAARAAGDQKLPTVEMARLANSARGMMDCFQNAVLSLQQLRSRGRGGSNSPINQHIQLNDNSQAVIASRDVRGAQHEG